uniref:Uncharacterized protein n=1 Tax=Noccaea caerulescens TaxID=107243 RepID=A0A1J3CB79_NOCCA
MSYLPRDGLISLTERRKMRLADRSSGSNRLLDKEPSEPIEEEEEANTIKGISKKLRKRLRICRERGGET